jgi:hypothetical protein
MCYEPRNGPQFIFLSLFSPFTCGESVKELRVHHLQRFNEAENEHKDLLKQQRLDIVAKHFKEFNISNAKKKEAIK